VGSWRHALTAVAVTLVAAVPAAHAGTYDVVACDAAGGANNSWIAYIGNSLGTTAYTTCPTGGDPWRRSGGADDDRDRRCRLVLDGPGRGPGLDAGRRA
jgi:hypothetical protein